MDMEPFVDKHREALIRRVTVVDPILHDIKDLLTTENYEYIWSRPTSQEKMIALFLHVSAWSHGEKETLYNSLKKHNELFIRDLEEKGRKKRNEKYMEPFVDKHCEELIRRVTVVDPILHDIRHLLTTENYKNIRSKPTSQEKMEALFLYVSAWSDGEKETLYNSLKKHNEHFIRDLEEKGRTKRNEKFFAIVALGSIVLVGVVLASLVSSLTVGFTRAIWLWGTDLKTTVPPDEVPPDEEEDTITPDADTITPERDTIIPAMVTSVLVMVLVMVYRRKSHKLQYTSHLVTITPAREKKAIKHPHKIKDEGKSSQIACQLCGKAQNSGDVIIPLVIKNTYRLTLLSAGLFQCQKTGIKFQVIGPVIIDYSLESWSDYLEDIVGDKYEPMGPLFNIKTNQPQVVSAVYLPHYLCLAGFTGDLSWIKCAHFKNGNMTLETPTRIKPFYIIFKNPDFSCLGPLLSLVRKKTPIHGIVLIYLRIVCPGEPEYQEYKIHLYLLPSTVHIREKLNKIKAESGFQRIEKPAQTSRPVYMKKKYLITGQPEADVEPKILQFEAREDPDEFTEISVKRDDTNIELYVAEEDDKDTVWCAKLTKGDVRHIARFVSVPSVDEEHFVDKHRKALIERLSHVVPVLDDLLGQKLLTQEQYEVIRKKEPHQEKMRQLYQFMTIWGNTDKEKLYRAIWRNNEPLIRDLEGC